MASEPHAHSSKNGPGANSGHESIRARIRGVLPEPIPALVVGEVILAVAVLSILLTAPVGAWAISMLGPRVLEVAPAADGNDALAAVQQSDGHYELLDDNGRPPDA